MRKMCENRTLTILSAKSILKTQAKHNDNVNDNVNEKLV